MTEVEKLILYNQYDILSKLDPRNADRDYDPVRQSLLEDIKWTDEGHPRMVMSDDQQV